MVNTNGRTNRIGRSLVTGLVVCGVAATAVAVMPPYVYRERIQKSAIKAIATVQSIRVVSTTRGIQKKELTFRLERSLGKENPAPTFAGTCYSVLKGADMPAGGQIYMYPKKGDRVYVTIGKAGGELTSYTRLTPALERALVEDPSAVKIGMGSVRLDEGGAGKANLPALAREMAGAVGLDAWGKLKRLRFTWTFHPKKLSRSYDWDLVARTVKVATGDKAVTVPQHGAAVRPLTAEETEAHKAFINDSYWLLFPLYVVWNADEVRAHTGAGVRVPDVPGLDGLAQLSVRYTSLGGYTPGDRYVLFVGPDKLPRAWAYFRGDAPKPTLVTTRDKRRKVGGLSLATEFKKPDGTVFITTSDLAAE